MKRKPRSQFKVRRTVGRRIYRGPEGRMEAIRSRRKRRNRSLRSHLRQCGETMHDEMMERMRGED